MIKMIFEGGYEYYMMEAEYKALIGLAIIGGSTIIGTVIAIGTYLTVKIARRTSRKA